MPTSTRLIAADIRNRPELNARMTKAALLSQYAVEIERLKADLLAARERNGIFLSAASWADLASEHEARRLALEDSARQVELTRCVQPSEGRRSSAQHATHDNPRAI